MQEIYFSFSIVTLGRIAIANASSLGLYVLGSATTFGSQVVISVTFRTAEDQAASSVVLPSAVIGVAFDGAIT